MSAINERKKQSKWEGNHLLLLLAILACIMGVFFLKPKPQTLPEAQQLLPEGFQEEHYNTLKTDSFIALAKRAYGQLLIVKREKKELVMELKKGNELAKDFFNGNDALLSEDNDGFRIIYHEQEQTVQATFDVDPETNGVNVPNDVLIKMMEKSNAQLSKQEVRP